MTSPQDAYEQYESARGEIRLLNALFPGQEILPLNDKSRVELMISVYEALEQLHEKLRQVIKLRYGIGGSFAYTQEETSIVMKLTEGKVRRLEKSGLDLLRTMPTFEKFFQK